MIAASLADDPLDTPVAIVLVVVSAVVVLALLVGLVVILVRGNPEQPEPRGVWPATWPRYGTRCGVAGCNLAAVYVDQHVDGTQIATCPGDHDTLLRAGWIVLPYGGQQ